MLWFLLFFCVSREEWNRRQDIRRKRKARLRDFSGPDMENDTKLQEELKVKKVERALAEKEAKYEIALAQRKAVSSNPMGYPSAAKTKHNLVVNVKPKDWSSPPQHGRNPRGGTLYSSNAPVAR